MENLNDVADIITRKAQRVIDRGPPRKEKLIDG